MQRGHTNLLCSAASEGYKGQGHTLFAAICLAFFGAIFWEQRKFGWCIVLGCWASSVAFSRLWLGMHHPADLMGSIILVALFIILHSSPNHFLIESAALSSANCEERPGDVVLLVGTL